MKGQYGERVIYDIEAYDFEKEVDLPVIEEAHINSHSPRYEEEPRLIMNSSESDFGEMIPDQWYKCTCQLEGQRTPQYLIRRAIPITEPKNRETGETISQGWGLSA